MARAGPMSGEPPASPQAPGEDEPELGWLAREVEEELPQLRLLSCEVTVGRVEAVTAPCPRDVQERLRGLSNRFRGARAIGIRREPVPSAYRVFFRQIGLDPDLEHTPIEAAVRERMLRGGFLPGTLLEDVLLVALLDTSIPVWALAGDAVEGPLGIRVSAEGERLGRAPSATALPAGRLVVADASTPLAILFGEVAPGHLPLGATRDLKLFAVAVAGVPALYAEEALWICRTALEHTELP